MLARFATPCVSLFLALLVGCSSNSAAGGSAGRMNESAGRAGGVQSAVASANGGGGATGVGGTTSGNGGSTTSSAGTAGIAGVASGSGGRAGNGAGGVSSGGAGAGAPTFTLIYDEIITPSCGGTQCHLKKPTPYGYDFSSKAAASAAWRADVIAGDGANSPMFQVLNFGIMPKGQAQLSIEKLYLVLDWIDAGALDD